MLSVIWIWLWKFHICFRIGINFVTSSMNLDFKYEMNRQFLVYPIGVEEALLKAIWEHLKFTSIPFLKSCVETVTLGNQNVKTLGTQEDLNVTLYIPSPLHVSFITQEIQDPYCYYWVISNLHCWMLAIELTRYRRMSSGIASSY